MTDVASSGQQMLGLSEAELISNPQIRLPPAISTQRLVGEARIDTFSPVNQNGSFEIDRVLKSGLVYKRTKKTKVKYTRIDLIVSLIRCAPAMEEDLPCPPSKSSLSI